MVILLQILSALAIIAFIVLIFRLFKSLNKADVMIDKSGRSLDLLTKEIQKLTGSINESLEDIHGLKDNIEVTMKKIDNVSDNINKIAEIGYAYSKDLRELSRPYEHLIKDTYPKIAEPVNKTTALISAVIKAAKVFKDRLSR